MEKNFICVLEYIFVMMFEIEKVLIIDSPKKFWNILVSQNFFEEPVKDFVKSYLEYLTGCQCDFETNWEKVMLYFSKLSEVDLEILTQKIGCDKIKFKYDNN